MDCKNCGAPMMLNRERDYYYCEYCGTFYFPSASPEGLRALGENPEGIRCPVCGIILQMIVVDDHHRGYYCERCRGFLFSRPTFRQLLESRRARATTPPEPPTRYDSKELQRRIACPKCFRTMETYPYLGPGNIVIDTCGSCDLIWLDYREMDKAINAPGNDRGVRRPEGNGEPFVRGHPNWRIPDDESDDDDNRYQREDSREEKTPGILQWLERFLDLD